VFLNQRDARLHSLQSDKGNPDVHIILRGGSKGPNYAAEYVRDAGQKLAKAGLPQRIMVRVLEHIL
jgi:3-deoxy-7-phosphoheptulonate synthase